ncbi:MAG: sodium:solute symporter [Planctomycetota bacterium]
MNMNWIDWGIVGGLLVLLTLQALWTRKYMKSVADFLAAGRCARRYMLSIADGMAALGAITILGMFEVYYEAGFTTLWWGVMTTIVYLIITLSGWVIYRYRQTRAMTLAQFFEIRYSRNFRIFAGIISFGSGIVNFGLFPAVGAHFFIYFCELPQAVNILGFGIPIFPFTVFILLAMALFFTFIGGQIAVMVTDFAQGLFCNIALIIIMVIIFRLFDWSKILEALSTAPADASMINPFHVSKTKTFNFWYFLTFAIYAFYSYLSWQGAAGYNCSALTPHEARMGKILGNWRWIVLTLLLLMLPIAAYTLMHHPDFAGQADSVRQVLSGIDNDAVRSRVIVPLALSRILPTGILGCFCAVIFAAFISTHDTYLHSWGSIFIQDVIMPFRKKPFENKQHMILLRLSILAVAVFVFLWAIFFKPTQNIYLYFAITGAIYAGAGAAIIGGLYWKLGTTLAAWCAMIVGLTFGVGGIVIKQINPDFFVNEQWMLFITMVSASITYVLVSLLGKKNDFNMDRMLHRGKYADEDDASKIIGIPPRGLKALFSMSKEFTRSDKAIYVLVTAWAIAWAALFIFGTIYQIIFGIKTEIWAKFWHFYVILGFVLGIGTLVWFTIGGIRDMKDMYRILGSAQRDYSDDGTVTHDNERSENNQLTEQILEGIQK